LGDAGPGGQVHALHSSLAQLAQVASCRTEGPASPKRDTGYFYCAGEEARAETNHIMLAGIFGLLWLSFFFVCFVSFVVSFFLVTRAKTEIIGDLHLLAP
jgi:hypothetical protein